jgi:homoserine dehydrogenase
VEGIDAAYKLAIMASLAFQSQVKPEDIYCEGISRIGSRDFRYAKDWGFTIKLLAIAKDQDGAIEARVHPVFIPDERFLAKVDGVYNAILVDGDLIGQVTFIGRGAGAEPTSSAVVADVVRAAHDIACCNAEVRMGQGKGKPVRPISELKTRYYVRMNIADRAGVLAQIAGVFGDNRISIASAIQKEADEKSRTAEVVIMTHPAKEKSVQAALAELKKLDAVIEINNTIRVEE